MMRAYTLMWLELYSDEHKYTDIRATCKHQNAHLNAHTGARKHTCTHSFQGFCIPDMHRSHRNTRCCCCHTQVNTKAKSPRASLEILPSVCRTVRSLPSGQLVMMCSDTCPRCITHHLRCALGCRGRSSWRPGSPEQVLRVRECAVEGVPQLVHLLGRELAEQVHPGDQSAGQPPSLQVAH